MEELKFHKGDWVVHNKANFVFKVVSIGSNGYEVVNRENYKKTISFDNDVNYRLWSIRDAKDGDVLASKDGADILIFRRLDTTTSFSSYYNLRGNGELGWNTRNFIPATKGQRDTLMKAMTDAGYTFDFDKKELKKIEQKQDWSEEDEETLKIIDRDLHEFYSRRKAQAGSPLFESQMQNIRWLKSLKDRVGCEVICTTKWKPTDEQMKALRDMSLTGCVSDAGQGQELIDLYNDLKKLREE